MAGEAGALSGGLVLSGTVLARQRVVNRETGEVRGFAYRVLAGADVFEVSVWSGEEPSALGSTVEWPVRVRAFVRKAGGVGWSLTVATPEPQG